VTSERFGDAPFGYNSSDHPPFAVTVDLTVFTIRNGRLSLLLVLRGEDPYAGCWALPGGFVHPEEGLDAAAARKLPEETKVDVFTGHLEQLASYGDPGRDPRMRVVSVAYLAFAPDLPEPVASYDAAQARWWAADDVLDADNGVELAFDHQRIILDGLERVRAKLEYTTLATQFVAEPFTLGDLHAVYVAVWGEPLRLTNFRRKVMSTEGFIVAVDDQREPGAGGGRPATLYRRGDATELHPPLRRDRDDIRR
jgi:8-oxo-dGTP diphosphatase